MNGSRKLLILNSAKVASVASACFCLAGVCLGQSGQESISRGVHLLDAPQSAPADAPTAPAALQSPPPLPPAAPGVSPEPSSAPLPTPTNADSSPNSPAAPLLTPAEPSAQGGSETPLLNADAPPGSTETSHLPPLVPASPSIPVESWAPKSPHSIPRTPAGSPNLSPTELNLGKQIPESMGHEDETPSVQVPAMPGLPRPAGDLSSLANTPGSHSPPSAQALEALSHAVNVPNSAGLSVRILPGPQIAAGSQVGFEISTYRPGYLILLDVNAVGKLSQIYPNPMSLMEPGGVKEKSNFVQPGKILRLPDRENPYSRYDFIAAPPPGTAVVVALLSDRPVQLVDLPDIPPPSLGGTSTIDDLVNLANGLRIAPRLEGGSLEQIHWSFDVKFYAIR